MKALGLFVALLLLATGAHALDFGDTGDGVVPKNLTVSTVTILNTGASQLIMGNATTGNYSQITLNAASGQNGVYMIKNNNGLAAQFFASGTGAVLRTDINVPLFLGFNAGTQVKFDASGIGLVSAATIRGTLTPIVGQMIYNTSTPGEVCIATATNSSAWVQLREITTPCSN